VLNILGRLGSDFPFRSGDDAVELFSSSSSGMTVMIYEGQKRRNFPVNPITWFNSPKFPLRARWKSFRT